MAETTHVFAASLADNLRLAAPDAGDAALIGALRRAGLETWFASLPDRLATVLGAGGRPMSAGERQRLGLARTLLAGGDVLALDEPTAHIDPASSADVLAELVGAAGSRAVLVVSHEPDLGRLVDEIVTLDAGRVVTPVAGE
jgi:ABC-type transport system involved in cytochrome bd biosynthesis fused ATPase/permease subunit